MTPRRLLAGAATVATAALFGAVALAADPSSGTVDAKTPKVEWTGEVSGDPVNASNLAFVAEAGGTNGVCPPEPTCSEFALEVGAAGNSLEVVADGPGGDDWC